MNCATFQKPTFVLHRAGPSIAAGVCGRAERGGVTLRLESFELYVLLVRRWLPRLRPVGDEPAAGTATIHRLAVVHGVHRLPRRLTGVLSPEVASSVGPVAVRVVGGVGSTRRRDQQLRHGLLVRRSLLVWC